MTGRAPGRLQGDDLIGEVLRNMEEGLFRIRQKTLVPAIYRIYLSPDDYEPFRDVVPFIAGEIRTALDERLAAWNTSRRKLAANLLKKIGASEAAAAERVRACQRRVDWSKFIPTSTANSRLVRLRFIQNWERHKRPSMGSAR